MSWKRVEPQQCLPADGRRATGRKQELKTACPQTIIWVRTTAPGRPWISPIRGRPFSWDSPRSVTVFPWIPGPEETRMNPPRRQRRLRHHGPAFHSRLSVPRDGMPDLYGFSRCERRRTGRRLRCHRTSSVEVRRRRATPRSVCHLWLRSDGGRARRVFVLGVRLIARGRSSGIVSTTENITF